MGKKKENKMKRERGTKKKTNSNKAALKISERKKVKVPTQKKRER